MMSESLVHAVSAARRSLLAAALIWPASLPAISAPVDEPAARRLTVTLLTLDMAQAACGFRTVQPRLAALLAAAKLTREQLYGQRVTPELQATIDGLQSRFMRNAATACADAWRQFGPESEDALLAR